MKYLFSLFLFFVFIGAVYAQQPNDAKIHLLPLVENKIVYSAQINVDSSIDKSTFFGNAEDWYKKNFETADNTLTIDNTRDGILSGTGIIHQKKHDRKAEAGDVFFTIDIHVNKGMYAYKVYNIYGFDRTGKFYYSDMYNEELYPTDKPKWPEPYRRMMLNSMNEKIYGTIQLLENEMKANRK